MMIALLCFFSFFPNTWALPPEEQLKRFDDMLIAQPAQIWSPAISDQLKSAIHDYDSRVHLKNGLAYGDSVRFYSLKGKCPADIEKDMKKLGCTKQVDMIREPVKNEPILSPSGKPSPIWQFVCIDGGVIKVKPEGDPSSKYTPYPHGSRTLRYPADAPYRDYRDEVAKISEDGHIIPRSPSDLAPKDLIEGWSKDAHIPLRSCQ